jgi:hypothetical protein
MDTTKPEPYGKAHAKSAQSAKKLIRRSGSLNGESIPQREDQ